MRRSVTKSVVTVALTTCLGVGLPATVSQAQAPGRLPLSPQTYFLPAGAVCAFDLLIDETRQREVIRFFSGGRVRFTGSYRVTLTNVATGKSLAVNATGPGSYGPDSTTVEGPQLFALGPQEPFGGGLYLINGRTTYGRTTTGLITNLVYTGTRSANLCNQL